MKLRICDTESQEDLRMQTSHNYIVDHDGNFRFTKNGLKEVAPLLAKAGINTHSIKTYEQYIKARKAASPYFLEYLQEQTNEKLADKPDTLEWNAIRAIVFETPEEADALLAKVKKKKQIFNR